MKLNDLLHKFSYNAYRSPDNVAEITRDKLMARPILFYEKIAALFHIHPHVIAAILIIWLYIAVSLQRWENPEVWEITVSRLTLEKMALPWVLWSFLSLIFFYLLPVIKETYFQTLQTLKPLISRSKYEELKANLVRDKITYSVLTVAFTGLIMELIYELYLGYELGFCSENLPIWCGLRYGPISYSLGFAPLLLWAFFWSDIFNEAFSWFYLPFTIKTSMEETSRKDPEIFGDVKAFDKFNKSIIRVTLLLVTISALQLSIILISPPLPLFRMWYFVILFLFVPYLFASRLKGSAIKKSIAELQEELKVREKRGDRLGSAQTAERLADFQKSNGQMDQSYHSILQAANNYEKAGEYEDSAKNYSLAGKHEEAAEAYKKQSEEEEDVYFAKYYEACYYSELSESLMTKHRIEEAHENLNLTFSIFRQLEGVAEDKYLKNSSLYRKWECEGRLHVINALKGRGSSHDVRIHGTNIESSVKEFDKAIKIFKKAKEKCEGLGDDAELQLYIHVTWCEIYKCLLEFMNLEKWKIKKMPRKRKGVLILKDITIQLISLLKVRFKVGKVEERDMISLLDASLTYLANMRKELAESNRIKVKLQVDMARHTLLALKEYNFLNDDIKASDNAKKAIKAARELGIWKRDVEVLNDQIDYLLDNILYLNFQFSAPKCPVVNINAYKDYVQFTYDVAKTPHDKNYLRFKIYYDPPRGEAAFEDAITVKLIVTCDGKPDEMRLQIEARKEVTESVPIEFPCYLMKAKLSYVASSDCARQLDTKDIYCDELAEMMR